MTDPLSLFRRSAPREFRTRLVALYAVLIAANVAAWAWAFVAFRHYPLLIGTALLAYGLGVRHAIDADHIAAIDNVTRKLMQDGRRPLGIGFFFSLGHSTVVVLASVAIAATAMALSTRLESFRNLGGMIGTIVSALFLLVIAIMNLFILVAVYRTFHHVRRGGEYVEEDLNALMAGSGFLARVFRPLFAMIRESWHMFRWGCCSDSASTPPPKSGCSASRRRAPRRGCRSGRSSCSRRCSRRACRSWIPPTA